MGASLTRNRDGHDNTTEASSQNTYRYPPKTGSYFGTHFIMGGERFESPQPGEYLFGESEELNFLGNKPVPFPYPVPSGNEPTKTLKSLVYIRKDSVRLVKVDPVNKTDTEDVYEGSSSNYTIEFTFDSDVKCGIRIHYFCAEDMVNGHVVYYPRDPTMSSDTYHYKRGAGQSFSHVTHTIDPSNLYSDEEWQYSVNKDVYPIAIHCMVEEEEHLGHAHVTYATIEKSADGVFTIKPLKQKQVVDGLCYLLQEIYGIENKNMDRLKDVDPDDEVEDSGAECVICMSDMRDTLILPCRHLCLCSSCADSLRYQASMCPICRVKFRALLQIRAMRKKVVPQLPVTGSIPLSDSEDNQVNQEGVPSGYEAISLIEALNGQVVPTLSGEGVHLQISGPLPVFTVDKKGQKETKVTVSGPIEYQKEMDSTDKESSKGTLEKKDKDKKLDTTDVTSTEANSDVSPENTMTTQDINRSPPKATIVTVRCSTDGKMITETNITSLGEANLPKVTTPVAPKGKRHHEVTYKKGGEHLACGLSTGDMADDEREDSSEPEADYDDVGSDPGSVRSMSPKSSNASLYRPVSTSLSLAAIDVEAVDNHNNSNDNSLASEISSSAVVNSDEVLSMYPKSSQSKSQKSKQKICNVKSAEKEEALENMGAAGNFKSSNCSINSSGGKAGQGPATQPKDEESLSPTSNSAVHGKSQPEQFFRASSSSLNQNSPSGYNSLQQSPGVFSDRHSNSGTEGSSFGSNSSAHALLTSDERDDTFTLEDEEEDNENDTSRPEVIDDTKV